MQESADNVSADSVSPSKDALLEEACRKYDEATRLCPTLHDVSAHHISNDPSFQIYHLNWLHGSYQRVIVVIT